MRQPAWIDWLIGFGAGFFILALLVSAIFDPTIRVLHTLQALIYVAVIVLTRRRSAWGYGAGFFIATFWNYTNLFVTNFISNGVQQVLAWMHTGHLRRPDQLIALIAAAGHFAMIAGCVAGLWWIRPRGRQIAESCAGGLVAIGFFVLIIFTTGRQYVPLVKRIFHLQA